MVMVITAVPHTHTHTNEHVTAIRCSVLLTAAAIAVNCFDVALAIVVFSVVVIARNCFLVIALLCAATHVAQLLAVQYNYC